MEAEAQEERLQAELGGLEVGHRVLARQLHAVAAVGLDLVAGLLRDQRGGDDKTLEPLPGQVAVQDVAAGAGFIGEDEAGSLALKPADELVDVSLAGADLSDVGHLVNIQTDEEGGRLVQG